MEFSHLLLVEFSLYHTDEKKTNKHPTHLSTFEMKTYPYNIF